MFSPVSLDLNVDNAQIPNAPSPHPTLAAKAVVTNGSSDEVVVSADELSFQLIDNVGELVDDLPIAEIAIDENAEEEKLQPGEQAEVAVTLKVESETAETGVGFWLKAKGFDSEVITEFEFDEK